MVNTSLLRAASKLSSLPPHHGKNDSSLTLISIEDVSYHTTTWTSILTLRRTSIPKALALALIYRRCITEGYQHTGYIHHQAQHKEFTINSDHSPW